MKILIIDNTIDKPLNLAPDFRRYFDQSVTVRRSPEEDLPIAIDDFTHVILSGSRTSCMDQSPWVLKLIELVHKIVEREIPLLGVCFGHQIIARSFGGDSAVRKSSTPEFGWVEVTQTNTNPILQGLPAKFYSFQSHFEEVASLPTNFILTASSNRCTIQSYYVKSKPIFGVQFHPERNASEGNASLLQRIDKVPKECIFGHGKAKEFYNENVARTIFSNFLNQKKR